MGSDPSVASYSPRFNLELWILYTPICAPAVTIPTDTMMICVRKPVIYLLVNTPKCAINIPIMTG